MPAPKLPETLKAISGFAAAEALDAFMANRPGWTSHDRGWSHDKTGINVEAREGVTPFRVRRQGATAEICFRTRAALELHLATAGA